MVTHSERFSVESFVIVPAGDHGGTVAGTWEMCPELPRSMGVNAVGSCEDLRVIVGTLGSMVAKLLGTTHKAFRVLTRYVAGGGLAGSAHWFRCTDTDLWVPHDEPWTACMSRQHGPIAEPNTFTVAA
ncbi:hypothetical protein [Streptomyces melanogenes]|uniref:hypothetical protein n=1 Tax=Streptomyces melanogenes TaxID=67326 RepID=UPI0037A150D5